MGNPPENLTAMAIIKTLNLTKKLKELVPSFWAPLTPAARLTWGLFKGDFQPNMLMALGIIIFWAAVFFSITLVTMRRWLTT